MAKSKKPAKQASSTTSPKTSKSSLKARVTEKLWEKVRSMPKSERLEIGEGRKVLGMKGTGSEESFWLRLQLDFELMRAERENGEKISREVTPHAA